MIYLQRSFLQVWLSIGVSVIIIIFSLEIAYFTTSSLFRISKRSSKSRKQLDTNPSSKMVQNIRAGYNDSPNFLNIDARRPYRNAYVYSFGLLLSQGIILCFIFSNTNIEDFQYADCDSFDYMENTTENGYRHLRRANK